MGELPVPFSMTPCGELVGYAPRAVQSRVRLPVYSTKRFSPFRDTAVMMLTPRITQWSNPGMALLLPLASQAEQTVFVLSVMNHKDPGYCTILSTALSYAQRFELLVWDAEQWRSDLRAFPLPLADELRRLPVLCLRTSLEMGGLDTTSLADACQRLGMPVPGHDLLAQAYSVRQCWANAVRSGGVR